MDKSYSVRPRAADRDGEAAVTASLSEAEAIARENARFGCRVFGDDGVEVYCPLTPLQCDIMREARAVTDLVRENGFRYGDAPVNPAVDCTARLVSCDRLVDWVLYRVGFTDQPVSHGMVVYHPADPRMDLPSWCDLRGFERIEDPDGLEPGDIVFVRPEKSRAGTFRPGHTFLFAGYGPDGLSYRYGCGKLERIQSVQPSLEPLKDFMFACRPVRPPRRQEGQGSRV